MKHLKDFAVLCLLMTGGALMEDFVWKTATGMFPFIGGYLYGVYRG